MQKIKARRDSRFYFDESWNFFEAEIFFDNELSCLWAQAKPSFFLAQAKLKLWMSG